MKTLRRTTKRRFFSYFAVFVSLAGPNFAQTKPEGPQSLPNANLNPSASYKYSIQPVQDARRSSDDLTDAEKWAWMVAQKRAATECDGYLSKFNDIQGEELFSLAAGKVMQDAHPFEIPKTEFRLYPESRQRFDKSYAVL